MYNMEISIGSYKLRIEIIMGIIVVFWVMSSHILCSCCKVGLFEGLEIIKKGLVRGRLKDNVVINTKTNTNITEGFRGANNTSMGPEFAGTKTPGYIMNPSTWSMPTLTYSPGTTPSVGVKAIWDRPKQPIPLLEGQLDMFATTEFKPECCPNAYSTSTGCACMTVEQFNFLKNRGFNNVPYSEF
jgi:hypothetical protein